MASTSEHLEKGKNNRLFAESLALENSTEIGWAITALFYSALHLVDAHSVKYNRTTPSHLLRNKEVQTNPRLRKIADDYLDLYTFSQHARYRMTKYGTDAYREAHEYLEAIEDYITPLL